MRKRQIFASLCLKSRVDTNESSMVFQLTRSDISTPADRETSLPVTTAGWKIMREHCTADVLPPVPLIDIASCSIRRTVEVYKIGSRPNILWTCAAELLPMIMVDVAVDVGSFRLWPMGEGSQRRSLRESNTAELLPAVEVPAAVKIVYVPCANASGA